MKTNKAHILYVEDDESLAFITKDNLLEHGYAVTHATSGQKAYEIYKTRHFDLCILDIMLPDMDGFTLCQNIRKTNTRVPVLFLSAKSLTNDKIKGLQLGADDYITKPFSINELVLRIEVFLKRSGVTIQTEQQHFEHAGVTFNLQNQTLSVKNKTHNLTYKEAQLLSLMLNKKNTILKRDDILKEVWGSNDYFLGRSLDVFISRLRKFLKEQQSLQIENIHGVGFRLKI